MRRILGFLRDGYRGWRDDLGGAPFWIKWPVTAVMLLVLLVVMLAPGIVITLAYLFATLDDSYAKECWE